MVQECGIFFKIHPNGTGLIDLSQNGNHTDMAEYLPSFSGNGEKIIFSARYGLGNSDIKIDIFLMDANGGSIKGLLELKVMMNSEYG